MFKEYLKKYNNLPVQIKASFWFLICMILQKGISVFTVPIFTRLLTPSEYGDFNVFNSWLGIVSVFITLKLSYGVYGQGLIKYKDNKKEFSGAIQGLMTSIILVSVVLYCILYRYINTLLKLDTYEVISMFIIIWSTTIFDFWAEEEKVSFKYKSLIKITILVAILQPLLGILVVLFFEKKVMARIISIAVINLFFFGKFFFLRLKKYRIFYSKKIWFYALKFNIPLIPHYLSQTLLNNSDRIMIERIIGAREAGLYSLSYSLALITTFLNGAIMQTMSPWIYKKIQEKKIQEIESIAYITLVLIATINLLLIAFAPEIIKLFAPVEYRDAIWIIPPISMSVLFMFAYDLFAKYEFYYEQSYFIMTASVIGASINILLNYFFIPRYGYLAAGYTTLICYIFYVVGHYLFMNKICKTHLDGLKPYNLKILLRIFITFLLSGFVLMLSYFNNVIRLFIILTIIFIFLINIKKIIDKIYILKYLKNK